MKKHNNLPLRARNLKLFYWKMRGWPGVYEALDLINKFCRYRKFAFGKYKGRFIGEIIVRDKQYVGWCLENISSFSLNDREKALYESSDDYDLGGYCCDFTFGDEFFIEGDEVDYKLLEWETKEE